jgi:hypothetical protein
MYKLFTTALIAAYAQADQVFEDLAVARGLASALNMDEGRELSSQIDPIEEGRMLAAEMDLYEERMLSSEDGHRQLSSSTDTTSTYYNDTRKTFMNGRNRKSGLYYRNASY